MLFNILERRGYFGSECQRLKSRAGHSHEMAYKLLGEWKKIKAYPISGNNSFLLSFRFSFSYSMTGRSQIWEKKENKKRKIEGREAEKRGRNESKQERNRRNRKRKEKP